MTTWIQEFKRNFYQCSTWAVADAGMSLTSTPTPPHLMVTYLLQVLQQRLLPSSQLFFQFLLLLSWSFNLALQLGSVQRAHTHVSFTRHTQLAHTHTHTHTAVCISRENELSVDIKQQFQHTIMRFPTSQITRRFA